jgi:hypothetical protein
MGTDVKASTDLDDVIARAARDIKPEDVEKAQATSKSLDENPMAFGPIVMFAIDEDQQR